MLFSKATFRILPLCSILLIASGCTPSSGPLTLEEEIAALGTLDYNYHIRPVLSQNCFECHGNDPESREAELRLDLAASAYAQRDSTAAIVPGDPQQSLLLYRVTTSDPDERMPPPEAHRTLTERDVLLLKTWIEQGAEYKPHWAFIPVERPEPPGERATPPHPIDAFVSQRAQQAGLSMSVEAQPRALVRRLAFDLTGLPPTLEEIESYIEDQTPEAYEALVDRYLASPHFGERMAQEWLDVARYADTNGYSIDGGRHMWIWRDWVIQAFNENKPYDQFIVEQLAGDLLPDPTEAQLIATGFNRNHMITHEGGTIPEENLTNYVADRVKTTSEVFMGLTMACAQCHDHKFDPISQKEYYQYFAYFNTASDRGLDGDRGINSLPFIKATSPLDTGSEADTLKEALEATQKQLAAAQDTEGLWEASQQELISRHGQGFALHQTIPIRITTPNSGTTGEILPDNALELANPAWLAAYNVSARLPEALTEPVTGARIVFEPSDVTDGKLGHSQREGMEGSLVLTSLSISSGELPSDQVDLYRLHSYTQITASSSHPDFPTEAIRDERRLSGWAPSPDAAGPQHFTVTFDTPINPAITPYLTVMVNFGQGENLMPGKFRILAMTGTDADLPIPTNALAALTTPEEERTRDQKMAIGDWYRQSAPELAPLRFRINNLKDRLEVLADSFQTMVMDESDAPRTTHILNRGQYDQPLEAVSTGTPAALPSMPESYPQNRLGLAQWLTDPVHPLTARVTVNRYWQMLFETGLVPTAADFGSQGTMPTHPELLDWLAAEFVDSGWDVKHLLKTIVLSATYRQSSEASEQSLKFDPTNQWLARGPRFRLQAEFIRDAALQISGLLMPRLGGPSVRPYQPSGLWKEVSHYGSTPATSQVFVQDHGEKLYRRSLYTYWKRTSPPPSMMAFDAPNREVCVVTREVTNTPLQALILLNDPQFVEASRHFALRILREAPTNDADRIRHGYELALGRLPDRDELRVLQRRLYEERQHFDASPELAQAYLAVGESPLLAADTGEVAAWTAIANLILNLSETITRS